MHFNYKLFFLLLVNTPLILGDSYESCTNHDRNCTKTEKNKLKTKRNVYEVIDVSYDNKIWDFDAVASNIDGVLIRIGYRGYSIGELVLDKQFENFYNNFKGKTKIGYYFVTQAISVSEAEKEADFVIKCIKGKSNDFPIYLDIEFSSGKKHKRRTDILSKQQRTEYAIAFLKRIASYNYRAGIYTSENWYQNNLIYSEIINSGASIWVSKHSKNLPNINYYEIWQYTNKGKITGINGNVDRTQVYQNLAGWDDEEANCGHINMNYEPNIYSECINHDGICISSDTCTSYNGQSITKKCPNESNNIKCCYNIPCGYDGKTGSCMFNNHCSGKTVSGLCPGDSNFVCCISDTDDIIELSIGSGFINKNENEMVKKCQKKLIDLNYDCGSYEADGLFGTDTENCVKQFQQKNNINPNGVIDNNTYNKLFSYDAIDNSSILNNYCSNDNCNTSNDNQCTILNGKCMNPNNCRGIAKVGKCPGGNDNKCCLRSRKKPSWYINQKEYTKIICTLPNTNPEKHTVASSGCGPSCLSMAINILLGKFISPETLFYEGCYDIKEYYGDGFSYDALSHLAKNHGVEIEWTNNMDDVYDELLNGKPIIYNVGNEDLYNFTSRGHYILLYGALTENNVQKTYVFDPIGYNQYINVLFNFRKEDNGIEVARRNTPTPFGIVRKSIENK